MFDKMLDQEYIGLYALNPQDMSALGRSVFWQLGDLF